MSANVEYSCCGECEISFPRENMYCVKHDVFERNEDNAWPCEIEHYNICNSCYNVQDIRCPHCFCDTSYAELTCDEGCKHCSIGIYTDMNETVECEWCTRVWHETTDFQFIGDNDIMICPECASEPTVRAEVLQESNEIASFERAVHMIFIAPVLEKIKKSGVPRG